MQNVKKELLDELENRPKVKCIQLVFDLACKIDEERFYLLKSNYSEKDWENFLELIDFNYNSGYGIQNLFGTVWFEDGTWLERNEYDGSEWWEYKKVPEIPEKLL